MRGAHSHHIAF